MTRTVTVRSHHEVVRVDANPSATRVCRPSNVDHSLYLLRQKPAKGFCPNPDTSNTPTSTHAPGKYHPRNVPERANLTPPPCRLKSQVGKRVVVHTGAAFMLQNQNMLPSKLWASRPIQTVGSGHHRPGRQIPPGIMTPSGHHSSSWASCPRGGTHPGRRIVRKSCPVCSRARCPSSRSRSDQKEKLETI